MSTLEKRLADLEYIVGHLPEDLDARVAGVDVNSERRVDALAATLERRLSAVEHRLGEMEEKLGTIEGLLRELLAKRST